MRADTTLIPARMATVSVLQNAGSWYATKRSPSGPVLAVHLGERVREKNIFFLRSKEIRNTSDQFRYREIQIIVIKLLIKFKLIKKYLRYSNSFIFNLIVSRGNLLKHRRYKVSILQW